MYEKDIKKGNTKGEEEGLVEKIQGKPPESPLSGGLSKLSEWILKWVIDLEFSDRLINRPLRFVQLGMQFTILVAVLKLPVKGSLIVGGVGCLVIVVFAWVLGKTSLREKLLRQSGEKDGALIDINSKLDRLNKRLDRIEHKMP